MLIALRSLLPKSICCWILAAFWLAPSALAEPPLRVLTSIKPLQLLALAVGGEAVRAEALLAPQFSPHDYQLRPSDRAKLNEADLVFWVGPQLEAFLQPAFDALSSDATIVGLHDGDEDAHVWMDPLAAIQIARRMAAEFASLRPSRRDYFDANAERLATALMRQDAEHRAELKRLPAVRGYMVSHDAYSRFERRYGLAHRAALTNAADMPPSAKSLLQIERELAGGKIACVWREPEESKLLQRLLKERAIRTVTIDAMAAQIPTDASGTELFYQRLWAAVMSCVGKD